MTRQGGLDRWTRLHQHQHRNSPQSTPSIERVSPPTTPSPPPVHPTELANLESTSLSLYREGTRDSETQLPQRAKQLLNQSKEHPVNLAAPLCHLMDLSAQEQPHG